MIELFKTKPQAGLIDFADLLHNDRVSISRTPFGAPEGEERVYLKRAVAWKGKKLGSIDKYASKEEFVKEAVKQGVPAKVAERLYDLAKDSHALKGKKGVVAVRYAGVEKVMSVPAFLKMAKKLIASGREDILEQMQVKLIPTRRILPSVSIEKYNAVDWNEVFRTVEAKVGPIVAV